jgi:tetratricopeptide (TPR) repeat protein
MRRARVLVVGLAMIAGACAPKSVPVPSVSSPKFPDFVKPTVPPDLAAGRPAVAADRAWQFLQAGDLRNASRELSVALKAAPQFHPAETALGYVELAGNDSTAALARFDDVLQRQAHYAPALAGRGEALLALDRDAEAIAAFESAAAADPSLSDLRRRIEVLKFRSLQESLMAAREAAQAGRSDEAIRAYTTALASSPDSPFLYRELGIVEHQRGDIDAALEHFRRAVALDPADAESFEQIGDILEARNDLEGAAAAYTTAGALDPSPALTRKIEAIRARADLARLPAEYRAIESAPQITRADLAALIGVRLAPLLQARERGAVVITDVRSNWALPWITSVARAGVMDPFDNHTFQPSALVRRSDLAQAVVGLLSRIAEANPGRANTWEGARGQFSDLSVGHLAYPAASAAVEAGVLAAGSDGAFHPSRVVSGAEAIEAIAKIESMIDSAARGTVRP